jgi:hypothetical protein
LLIGHNIVGFDMPLWERISGSKMSYDIRRCFDTNEFFLMFRPGPRHSVEALSAEFGFGSKLKITDWKDPFSLDLYIERCELDVALEYRIYGKILDILGIADYNDLF